MLKITLVKSKFGNTPRNRAIVQSLGLNKTGRSVLQHDTPSIRGMIHKVKHLLEVEEVEEQPKTPRAKGHKAAARIGSAAAAEKKPKAAKPKQEAAGEETAEKPKTTRAKKKAEPETKESEE
ncbi:MAG: 50S ribosomal protein L30 [Fimbriimonadaceae bacterium]|nr:50S ribosomal protein L30 [Fimbriimonadaceae bacterium]QYK55908.1 MAG: 50S ribosomal protein L30 [Fimbriimonadaceae bacterium]